MEWNEKYITYIKEVGTTRKLLDIYEKMKKEAFFRYDIDLSKFDEKVGMWNIYVDREIPITGSTVNVNLNILGDFEIEKGDGYMIYVADLFDDPVETPLRDDPLQSPLREKELLGERSRGWHHDQE